MARKYTHMMVLEKEILTMKAEGKSQREIAKECGFELKQVKKFFERHNKRNRRIEAGIIPRHRGRPPKGLRKRKKISSSYSIQNKTDTA